MATKNVPQLKPEQQQIFVDLAKQENINPQELVDSMVRHFRAGTEYERYSARIEKAKASLDAGKGISHDQVMQKLRQRHTEKLARQA